MGTAGQSSGLSVAATGTGTLSYQWRRNGLNIPGATNANYTVASASRIDADYYDVIVASGLSTTISQVARLSTAPSSYPTMVAPDPAWNLQPEYTNIGGTGYAVVPLADGRVYIGGSFVSINGLHRTSVARLKADQTVDPAFAPPEIDGLVNSIAVQSDGKVLIAGEFTHIGAGAWAGVARLNTDGSLDTTFSTGVGPDNRIGLRIALQSEGKILVGGSFTHFSGVTRTGLVRLTAGGSIDATFQTQGFGGSTVAALAFQSDGKIVVGGQFTVGYTDLNGTVTPRTRLARLNADGTLDTAFAPTADGVVNALALQADGKIVIGGAFTHVTGTTTTRIARLNTDGTVDTAFSTATGAGFGTFVNSIGIMTDGKIVVGGSFSTVNNVSQFSLARLNSDGTPDTAYPIAGSIVYAIVAQPGGQALIAGGFTFLRYGSTTNRQYFARVNADATIHSSLNLAVRGAGLFYLFLPLPGGKTLVAGRFSHLRGAAVPNDIVRLNADQTIDASFNAGGSGANELIFSGVVQADGKIVLSGHFYSYNATPINRLIRLTANGRRDYDFDPGSGLDGPGYTMALLPGGKILVAGEFTNASGVQRNRVAVYTTDGVLDPTFDPGSGFNGSVYSSAVQSDGKIILGGNFGLYNGATANHLVRINPDGTRDTSFNTSVAANNTVGAVALQADGRILIGGSFTSYTSVARNNVARLTSTGTLDTTFVPPTLGTVEAVLPQEDGKVVIRGLFPSVGGAAATAFLGRLNSDGTRDTSFLVGGFSSPPALPPALVMRDNGQIVTWTSGPSGLLATQPAALPAISAQPLAQGVVAGSTVTFSVTASSVLPFTYQWQLNGTPITDANAASLVLTNIQASNAGNYTVVLTSELGSTTSAVAALTVGTVPAITTQPANQTVTAGQTASFTVVATGTPSPTYQWQRQAAGTTGFINLSNAGAYSGATSASLTITAATGAMHGDQFQVVVSNGIGAPVTSSAVALSVNVGPAITTQPANQTITAGQTASLTVVATGTPAPTYQWRKAGSPISGATAATYTKTNAQTSDSGSYDVVVTNVVTSVTSIAATLTVNPAPTPPSIVTPPVTQSVAIGTAFSLHVSVSGTAPFTYQWNKGGSPISGATNATYSVASAASTDAGSYTVTITNGVGNVTSGAAVITTFTGSIAATHAVVGNGYFAGGTATVTNTLTYTGTATSLGWQVLLPAGWSYASDAGSAGDTKPGAGTTDLLEWAWTTIPASPVTFTYTVNVPANQTGNKEVVALSIVRLQGVSGALQVVAKSDPLVVQQITTHSGDTDRNFKISLLELTRVIELYNTRNGTSRTGCYKVDATGEDGFNADPTRTSSTVVTLAQYHSGDSNHDGKLSLLELTRVIELYNYRSGTTRTGQYHVNPLSEDGFDPGP